MGYTSHINTTQVIRSGMHTRLLGHLGPLHGQKPPLTIREGSLRQLRLTPMINLTSFIEMVAGMVATLPTRKRPAVRGQ